MTSATTAARRPRRKWGWIFVVLFVFQAIAFAAIIGTDFADANRERDLARSFIERPSRGCEDMDCRIGYAGSASHNAQLREQEAKLLMVLAGICSIVTLTLAFVGLRRRKALPVAP